MTRCFPWVADREILQAKETIEYPVYRERLENDVQLELFQYRVGRWCLAGLEDKAQPLEVRCQKCTVQTTVDSI